MFGLFRKKESAADNDCCHGEKEMKAKPVTVGEGKKEMEGACCGGGHHHEEKPVTSKSGCH